jgi:hypothetical protein
MPTEFSVDVAGETLVNPFWLRLRNTDIVSNSGSWGGGGEIQLRVKDKVTVHAAITLRLTNRIKLVSNEYRTQGTSPRRMCDKTGNPAQLGNIPSLDPAH